MQTDSKVKFRLPPAFIEGTQDSEWTPTPPEWLYGPWKMVYTSQEYYWQKTKNLTIQYGPVMNGSWPCANQELVTLTPLAQPDRFYTAFGIDSPLSNLDDAWLCQCTGHLSHVSDYVAFLAWGTDTKNDWLVLYSMPPPGATVGLPAQVAIMSRGKPVLCEETVKMIAEGIRGLGDEDLSRMMDNLQRVKHDANEDRANQGDALRKLPPCGYDAIQNVDSLTRF